MKGEIITSKEFKLSMSEGDALWLKAIMQNPLYADDPSEEDPVDKERREKFWKVLSQVLGGAGAVPRSGFEPE